MTATAEKPKYIQLADHLRKRINSGDLKVGDRLPSYAEMYRDFGATTATVQRVCNLLEQENLIERRSGSGIYVAERKNSLTGKIGLILTSKYMNNPLDSPYMHALYSGIVESAQSHGLELQLVGNPPVVSWEKMDGVLIYCRKDKVAELNIPEAVPKVLLLQHANNMSSVLPDDFQGARLAVEHFVKCGHRRIACLMESVLEIPARRIAGYRVALEEAGIDANPQWLKEAEKVIWPTGNYLEWSKRNMLHWLKNGWAELGCTAILVQNEVAAIGVMQALQENGIRVPQEVSIIGCDGTMLSNFTHPRLTSIELPYEDIGKESVKVLYEQIHQPSQENKSISLPVTLRKAESVAII